MPVGSSFPPPSLAGAPPANSAESVTAEEEVAELGGVGSRPSLAGAPPANSVESVEMLDAKARLAAQIDVEMLDAEKMRTRGMAVCDLERAPRPASMLAGAPPAKCVLCLKLKRGGHPTPCSECSKGSELWCEL